MDKLSSLKVLFIVLALGAGCVMALQPAVNRKLSTACNHAVQASVISFGTGFIALLAISTAMRVGLPSWPQLAGLPWWAWTGGLLGTYMVTVSFLVAPTLGATRWIGWVLTGQIALSLVLDHFGWLDYDQQPINRMRVLGIGLVILGVVIVSRN